MPERQNHIVCDYPLSDIYYGFNQSLITIDLIILRLSGFDSSTRREQIPFVSGGFFHFLGAFFKASRPVVGASCVFTFHSAQIMLLRSECGNSTGTY